MKFFDPIIPAVFRSRPNRFVVHCTIGKKTVQAYLPNPGRLWELLLPDARLALVRLPPQQERKLDHVVVGVEHDGRWIMLHTHRTNAVAQHLIETNNVPGLEGAAIVQPEYRIGKSRFDFLLKKDGRDVLLEVKSCTLFHHTLAMFPDAISARAVKHLRELEALSQQGYGAAVLFVVHSPCMRYFLPEHHTDLEFSRTLLSVKDRVLVRAVGVEWDEGLALGSIARNLVIPWDLADREAHDCGSYIVILHLAKDETILIGGLGTIRFRKGFYCYAGSAKQSLSKRLARHGRARKKLHWHIDYLRERASMHAAIPIRTEADLECAIASGLAKIADQEIPGFGSSDCACASHLFRMQEDPLQRPSFIKLLLQFRMGLLEEELAGAGR